VNIFLIVIVVIVALIWLFSLIKSKQHKWFAFVLIFLLLFSIYGFNSAFSGKNIQINSMGDFTDAVKIYFSWYGAVFNNLQILTTQAVKLDWKGNQTT